MESNNFKSAKVITENIERFEQEIYLIDRLLKSCMLSCKISGTPSNQFHRTRDYYSTNKLIKTILLEDKKELEKSISELKEKFAKL